MRIAALLIIILFAACKSKEDKNKQDLIDRQILIKRYMNEAHRINGNDKYPTFDKYWFDSLQGILDSCEIALKRY
jgi:hypothetical protein